MKRFWPAILLGVVLVAYAADVKISQLPSASGVTSDDLVAIVDSPGGTPATQKATAAQIASFVLSSDGEISSIAGLTSAADKLPYYTGSGTAALADFTSFARTLIDDTSASTARSTLGLVIGTNVEAWDTDLDTWATKTAPSGTVVGTSDSQTLTNKSISGSQITSSVATATALAANGSNCSSGQAAQGVDTSGNAEGCFTPSGGGGATVVGSFKSSSTSRTSSTPTADPHLSLSLPAGFYAVEGMIVVSNANNDGFKFGLITSGGSVTADAEWMAQFPAPTNYVETRNAIGSTSNLSSISNGSQIDVIVKALINVATATTLNVYWSGNTGSASTLVDTHSWFMATKLN